MSRSADSIVSITRSHIALAPIDGKKERSWYVGEKQARFWLSIMDDKKPRVENLIACVDGLNGFSWAVEAVVKTGKSISVLF